MEPKPKVLIVDDEKMNLDVLVDLLNPCYRTIVAKNGRQTFQRLNKPTLPDLILLDIMMPEMDGYEVCRRIKENPATQDIPVIFITGLNDARDEAQGFEAGAVDYIVKPFSPPVVLARVKTHVELKRRGDMLERIAGQDGLTGIPNRRTFDHTIHVEWKRSLRYRHHLSLVMLDIDYFKFYNDHYGHAEGDHCLKRVALAVTQCMPRAEDLAARYGGEEFACILPETGMEGVRKVARRIRKHIVKLGIPHAKSRAADTITVSIGTTTTIPTADLNQTHMIRTADKALYEAKQSGRNRIVHKAS